MPTSVSSFAKINLGLTIGAKRKDGFHELRTIYQTIALHDVVKVDTARGTGIEIRFKNREDARRIPEDQTNTCYRTADRVLRAFGTRAKITITIDKKLPVKGGLGAASSNAVATLIALEREFKKELAAEHRLRIAQEIGSDVPLFLIGGTVLGIGRGEQVFALSDLPKLSLVIVTPGMGISTRNAFAQWDEQFGLNFPRELTGDGYSAKINAFSRTVFDWLGSSLSGVSKSSGDRAEAPLLDLVRAGIENDFERVVFPKYPELREVKRALERAGARYASLSGSGSTLYGLFESKETAEKAVENLSKKDIPALATTTLPRKEYWKQVLSK